MENLLQFEFPVESCDTLIIEECFQETTKKLDMWFNIDMILGPILERNTSSTE